MGNSMNDAKGTELPLLQPNYPGAQCKKRTGRLTTQLLAALCILYVYLRYHGNPIHPWFVTSATGVHWKSCGEGYGDELQCANVSVPLDYRNESDGRTMSIAVTRLLAADKENRKGAVFINPGGPGGSGTTVPYTIGHSLAKILKDQYDIISFDPRGVNLTRPYVSCFDSQLELEAFAVLTNDFMLNIPTNLTSFPDVNNDVAQQVTYLGVATASLVKKCAGRTGESLQYLGTEFVVRDIDTLARLIEGPNERINYWGFSYGTVIGQYMVKILPPERLGKLVIDGVVNVDIWNRHSTSLSNMGLQDIDNVLFSFASTCLAAGSNCTLNSSGKFASASSLLAKIDETIDTLYAHPVPIYDMDVPAVVSAANMRRLLFNNMYAVGAWPALAKHLSAAFAGNFTSIAQATTPRITAGSELKKDQSAFAISAIICADTKPYSEAHPPPTDADLTELVFRGLRKYSRRFGDVFSPLAACHHWEQAGSAPKRSRYAGTFELADDTLNTPMLVLSSTYDPVTPLENAMKSNQRLGNNARLIQQTNGFGHCTISQVSYCTMRTLRRYFLEDAVPESKHTACEVDQVPFKSFEEDYKTMDIDEKELREATRQLVKDWEWNGLL